MAGRVQQMPAVDGQRLTDAVNDAVVRYARHRRPAVLRAWLGLAPRGLVAGGPALDALQDADHPAVGPMRELLQAADHAHIRAGLVASLAIPTLTLAAVAGLRRAVEDGTWGEAIAGREHLLDWSAVRRGLARAGEPQALLPVTWAHQSDAAVAALPAWIAALPLSPLDQGVRLEPLAAEAAPLAARFAATRRLIALAQHAVADPSRSADPRLLDLVSQTLRSRADDSNPRLARLAAAWLLSQAADPRQHDATLATLSRSRHPGVKRLAHRRLSVTAFDRLWHNWPKLSDTARLHAARTTLKLDALAPQRLEAKLRRGGRARTQALEMVTCVPPVSPPAATFAGGAA